MSTPGQTGAVERIRQMLAGVIDDVTEKEIQQLAKVTEYVDQLHELVPSTDRETCYEILKRCNYDFDQSKQLITELQTESGQTNKKQKTDPEPERDKTSLRHIKPNHYYDSREFIIHGQPREVEETFPLAMTYSVEPKQATYQQICSYIKKHYPDSNLDELQNTLDSGKSKKLWLANNVGYTLIVRTINPSIDTDHYGQIANAIVASACPKRCKLKQLQSYAQDFHPDLMGNEKQRRSIIHKAVQRALNLKLIRCVRSRVKKGQQEYELLQQFIPSPAVLQGNDNIDDYEQEENRILYNPYQEQATAINENNNRDYIVHSKPRVIEEAFLLAMTFSTGSKQAKIADITHYLKTHYPASNIEELPKALQQGSVGQLWFCTDDIYTLLTDTVNPYKDESLSGQIANAILALATPKQSTYSELQTYIHDFHPKLKVKQDPNLQLAIYRALQNNLIKLVGEDLGAQTRYELAVRFVPGPSVLKGTDKVKDYRTAETRITYSAYTNN